MIDPIGKVHNVQQSEQPQNIPKNPEEKFTQEELDKATPMEKWLMTGYSFSFQEAKIFNDNFVQQSINAMKQQMDKTSEAIKKMFKDEV